MIKFNAKLSRIGSWIILKLPKGASAKLPSRGMVMVEGRINGFRFRTVLEPDGEGGHWFRVDRAMNHAIKAGSGDMVSLEIEPAKDWMEPEVPKDLKEALDGSPQAHRLWAEITPNAHWDWIRWIRATKQAETRKRRIRIACSKLKAGMRRPCCFNRNLCTEPNVSNNGVLLKMTVR